MKVFLNQHHTTAIMSALSGKCSSSRIFSIDHIKLKELNILMLDCYNISLYTVEFARATEDYEPKNIMITGGAGFM